MSAPRAIAIAGCALAAVGLLGFIIYLRAILLWAIPVVFGVAALPRAVMERLSDRRRR